MRRFAYLSVLIAAALAGCAQPSVVRPPVAPPPAPAPAPPAKPANALSAGVSPGPEIASLGLASQHAQRALQAFRLSCPALQRRADTSGLTRTEDWAPVCARAAQTPDDAALAFFETSMELVRIGTGQAFATGYYEPEIAGARTQQPGFDVPIYKRPADLIEVDLAAFSDQWRGKRIRGRVQGQMLVPYADRAEIERGGLAGRGLELAWAADPIDFFFLQVQGSGRVRLPDGSILRIGYDGQNGRDYTAIGKVMRDRGLLGPGQANMDGIIAWLRANPDAGRAIMQENKSWVFFKELTGPGPLGALGVPVTGEASVAADPLFVPLGAPVFLTMERAEANGLWIAQDTGGAIKGPNRFDTFWGAGDRARDIAGGMAARGTAFVLLPKGSLHRLHAKGAHAHSSSQR